MLRDPQEAAANESLRSELRAAQEREAPPRQRASGRQGEPLRVGDAGRRPGRCVVECVVTASVCASAGELAGPAEAAGAMHMDAALSPPSVRPRS